jgi:predicted DNA binding CopG/RHH family protein
MFGKKEQPKSINFLETLYAASDIWSNAYVWLVNVGKYLLIAVQVVVLGVFFSRFVLDRKNNDLTEEINNNVVLLSNESWRKNAILFDNYQLLLEDVKKIRNGQELNSSKVSELISGIPTTFDLGSFSYNEGRVSLQIMSSNLETVKNYESALKNNSDYHDVRFSITKEDAEINVRVSFNLEPTD